MLRESFRSIFLESTDSPLKEAKSEFQALYSELAHVLGAMTVNVLVDRAVTEIGMAHPGLEGIRLDGTKLDLSRLEQTFSDRSPADIAAAFAALRSVLLLILARLVGKQMAEGLADRLAYPGEARPLA